MEIILLGTGSADGWPSPFCRCDSCLAMREAQEFRTPTSVLIDRRIWIDPGPEAARQALRAGVDLADVDTVLVGHAHSDHLAPEFLLHRSWVSDRPLTVYGPAAVIDLCRNWLAPDQTDVELVEVTAGDEFSAGECQIKVLHAAHEAFGEAVLYAVAGAGRRVLYACDTGPWAKGFLQLAAGQRFDLVLLEQTFGDRADLAGDRHLGFDSFAKSLAELRSVGLIDSTTRVVGLHLSHHNGPDVGERLAQFGAEVGFDGAVIELGQE